MLSGVGSALPLVAVQCRTRLRQGRRCLRDLLVEERDSDRQVDARRLGQSVVEALGEIRGADVPRSTPTVTSTSYSVPTAYWT